MSNSCDSPFKQCKILQTNFHIPVVSEVYRKEELDDTLKKNSRAQSDRERMLEA
jgi:hypothetical protein